MYFAAIALVGASLGQQPTIPATPAPSDQDYTYWNSRQIRLPIRYDQDKKTIARVELHYALNGENLWYGAGTATPDQDHFVFTAKEDGLYWFTIQDVDLQGHKNPADLTKTPPDLKVIVDTVKPRIQFTQCNRIGETIIIEWIVDDKNPNENQNRVHFRTVGSSENAWQEVSLPPSSKSGVRFLSGTTEPLIVRVTACDMAKNKSEATYEFKAAATSPISTTLTPVGPGNGAPLAPVSPISPVGGTSAPGIGAPFSPAQTPIVPAVTPASGPGSPPVPPTPAAPQVPVANQVAIPPAPLAPPIPSVPVVTPILTAPPIAPAIPSSPTQQPPIAVMPQPPLSGTFQSTSSYGTSGGGSPQTPFPAGTPSTPVVPAIPTPSISSSPTVSSFPTSPVGMGSGNPLPIQPPATFDPRASIPATPTGIGSGGTQVPLPAWSGQPPTSPTVEVTRANVINYLTFDVGYDVESRGPSGISRVDLWVTRDDGLHWQKWSQHDGKGSTIRVNLNVPTNSQPEGNYGFRIVPVSGAGLSEREPATGDAPELRVVVDITAPQLDLFQPVSDSANPDSLVILWKATDKNFTDDPITIEWSDKPTGPWQPVATGGDTVQAATGTTSIRRLPNTGQYAWRVPAGLSPRVYLKVCARDAAGNVREVVTRDPILVDLVKPRAKINGIVPPPAPSVVKP